MKPDDSSLAPDQRRRVREEAKRLLSEASAIGRFPTPVADLMAAARVEEAPDDILAPGFLPRMRRQAGDALKRALGKVVGLFHASSRLVFIDQSLHAMKKVFIRLHETAHGFLPWQRDLYAVVEDNEKCLRPEVADLFERQANVFATQVLFQLDGFIKEASDRPFGLRAPLDLSKKYGSSVYSAIREYVRKNPNPCAVLILDPPQPVPGDGFIANLRRVEESSSFKRLCGRISWPLRYTPGDPLGSFVPVGGRRMTRPREFLLTDARDREHQCLAEAFTQGHQVFILILVVHERTRIIAA